jgi:hypothetical protein
MCPVGLRDNVKLSERPDRGELDIEQVRGAEYAFGKMPIAISCGQVSRECEWPAQLAKRACATGLHLRPNDRDARRRFANSRS